MRWRLSCRNTGSCGRGQERAVAGPEASGPGCGGRQDVRIGPPDAGALKPVFQYELHHLIVLKSGDAAHDLDFLGHGHSARDGTQDEFADDEIVHEHPGSEEPLADGRVPAGKMIDPY